MIKKYNGSLVFYLFLLLFEKIKFNFIEVEKIKIFNFLVYWEEIG